MSSMTKTEFAAEIQELSPILASFTDTLVEQFIDMALRAFSRKRKHQMVSADNAVIAGQDLYDIPSAALEVIAVKDSETQADINYSLIDEGSGTQIRLGTIKSRSFATLLVNPYYSSPLSYQNASSVGSYSSFDIHYTVLYDMSTIGDDWLEALYWYAEYRAAVYKGGESVQSASEASQNEVKTISDTDPTGASTSVTFVTSADTKKVMTERAKEALSMFNDLTKTKGFGVRG